MQFNDIIELKEHLSQNQIHGIEQLKDKQTECLMITMSIYLSEIDNISLSVLHIMTRDEFLFDYLIYSFQSDTSY
jgi:hypothetical protein